LGESNEFIHIDIQPCCEHALEMVASFLLPADTMIWVGAVLVAPLGLTYFVQCPKLFLTLCKIMVATHTSPSVGMLAKWFQWDQCHWCMARHNKNAMNPPLTQLDAKTHLLYPIWQRSLDHAHYLCLQSLILTTTTPFPFAPLLCGLRAAQFQH